MIQVDLVLLVEKLRIRGCEACHEILAAPHGYQEGLEIDDDFFPLWELSLPENSEAVEQLDFAAIKARRGPNWSVRPPALGAY
jgi:hypothetical protein